MIATYARTAARAALAAAVVGTVGFGLFGSLTVANAGGTTGRTPVSTASSGAGADDGDVVCVTTAVRQQAKDDNAAAASRKASLNIWLTTYTAGDKCDGDVCTQTSDAGSQYKINGDHFDKGTITLIVNRDNGTRLAGYAVTAGVHNGYAGASFGYETTMWDPNSGFHAPAPAATTPTSRLTTRTRSAGRTGCPSSTAATS